MSPAELNITAITEKITVDNEIPDTHLIVESTPDVIVLASTSMGSPGPPGPPGPQGQWTSLTQAEYDALSPPNPETLYIIVGSGSPGQWISVTQAEYDALDPPDPETLYVIVQ